MVTFTGNTITDQTQEGTGNLSSTDMSNFQGTFTGNTITSFAADAVDTSASDTSTTSVNFMNNTLSSPGGFFDFNLNQNNTSTFDVVDFGNLPDNNNNNNNGAAITTSGAITDIPALP